MVEFVVTQQRDKIYPCKSTSFFNIKTVEHNGTFIGESLFMDRCYLGTFETYDEACAELKRIHNRKSHIYGVSGYSSESFTPEETQRQL